MIGMRGADQHPPLRGHAIAGPSGRHFISNCCFGPVYKTHAFFRCLILAIDEKIGPSQVCASNDKISTIPASSANNLDKFSTYAHTCKPKLRCQVQHQRDKP